MLLKTYFAMLVILVILEISVGIAAYGKRDAIPGLISDTWATSAKDIYTKGNSTFYLNTPLYTIEKTLQCCGFADPTNYPVPATPVNCGFTGPVPVGCKTLLENKLEGSLSSIGAAGIVIGVIEIIGLIFSVVMFRKIASKENAQNALLNEAWRINRTKVQYGYSISF
ncbi:Tetraspanin/Peripherin [Gorgonomyces haynaldii]|nr:Tetraspanin/Peripherin [Gorgonomyces haynaldii]